MKNRYALARLAAFLLSAVLLLASCGGGTSATTMHLVKTEGTVGVSDGDGRDIDSMENLGLYSGYQVGTQAKSYAWINLDDVKLTKMDAESQVEIARDGGKLEINVKSGSLFFNVTEPLSDDESMDIRTSSMMVGIRGTCGWVTQNTAALLEGTVTVTAEGESVTVSAGEMAVMTDEGTLEVKPLTASSVPAFVIVELENDGALAEEVKATSGLDVLNPPSVNPLHLRDMCTYAKTRAYHHANDELFREGEYFPDEQGRIGRFVSCYIKTGEISETNYTYNEEGTLQTTEYKDNSSVYVRTVTENTADHRKVVNEYDDRYSIYYYDEQGHTIRDELFRNSTLSEYKLYTYDAEGKLIRTDSYQADGSPISYVLYDYD